MNFNNIVLAFIDQEGTFYYLESSKDDSRHVSSYQRFLRIYGNVFSIENYLAENSSRTGDITGYDIAKFVCQNGGVVFFHTDVHNYFMNMKDASLMVPENMSDKQKSKLHSILPNMENGFNLHYGVVTNNAKNGKLGVYIRTDKTHIYNLLNSRKILNLGEENNLLTKYTLVVIDEDGNMYQLPKDPKDTHHFDSYKRLEIIIPGILNGYQDNLNTSSGFQLAAHISANGMIVIWPSDINNLANEIISLPEILTNEQCDKLGEILIDPMTEVSENIDESINYFVGTSKYKKRNSPKIVTKDLSQGTTYAHAYLALNDYIRKSLIINSTGMVAGENLSFPEVEKDSTGR